MEEAGAGVFNNGNNLINHNNMAKLNFKGQVNGVEYTSIEEYTKAMTAAINDGTLKNCGSQYEIAEEEEKKTLENGGKDVELFPEFDYDKLTGDVNINNDLLKTLKEQLHNDYQDILKLTFNREEKKTYRSEIKARLDEYDAIDAINESAKKSTKETITSLNEQIRKAEQKLILLDGAKLATKQMKEFYGRLNDLLFALQDEENAKTSIGERKVNDQSKEEDDDFLSIFGLDKDTFKNSMKLLNDIFS